MATNAFYLKIEGPEVAPETVDIGELFPMLAGLRGAVDAIASQDSTETSNASLSLIEVKEGSGNGRGSNLLTFVGSPLAIKSTGRLTQALATDNFELLPRDAHPHIRSLWVTTFDSGWQACKFLANGSQIRSASIRENHELFPEAKQFRGRTTLFGQCVRVGGEGSQKSAKMIFLDGTKKTIKVKTQRLAEEIGKHLFQTIGLEGEAFWWVETNEIESFRADALSEFRARDDSDKERTIYQSFEHLAKAAGNRWDGVDADEFVAEQRRD